MSAREVEVTMILKETDDDEQWDEEGVKRWLRENIENKAYKEYIVRIVEVRFPNGKRDDLRDEDIVRR